MPGLGFQPTIGQFTILWSLLLVACQAAMLRRKFRPIQLLQAPVAALFGVFIEAAADVVMLPGEARAANTQETLASDIPVPTL